MGSSIAADICMLIAAIAKIYDWLKRFFSNCRIEIAAMGYAIPIRSPFIVKTKKKAEINTSDTMH
jgi:hypothetical protein